MALYVGIISGTSVDGIDTALLEIKPGSMPSLLAAETTEYSVVLSNAIQQLIHNQHCQLTQLGQLDMALGLAYSHAALELLTRQNIAASEVSAIGCHGQTICHSPEPPYPFSMQIGNGNIITAETGITTITDFRQRDMVSGGQGAPLVPGFHEAVFRSADKNRVVVNIGGIANITVLPADPHAPVLGFDTGPGNTLMDHWIQQHQQVNYDHNGEWASNGLVNADLLALFLADPFFTQPAPKSSGREYFHGDWVNYYLQQMRGEISATDIQATLLEVTVKTITNAINQYAPQTSEISVCGGGAYNKTLMQRLSEALSPAIVQPTDKLGIQADYVEAAAFAWLAHQTVNRQPGNVVSVTGASSPCILGSIYYP